MVKKRLFCFLIVFGLLSVTTNVFAKEEPTLEVGEKNSQSSMNSEIVRPINAIDLEPAENTLPIFDEAYWYVNEKGETVQVTGLKVSPQDRGKSYKVTLDLEENEYIVEESISSISSIQPLATSQYTAGLRYSTIDPANIALNRSTHQMTWYGNGSDAWKGTRSASAWAANPSSLGTHWFVNANRYEGFVDEGRFVNSSSYHSYYNWDFLDDDKRTDVWHRVNIRGYGDGYVYYYAENGKSGEGNSLLSFKLDTF